MIQPHYFRQHHASTPLTSTSSSRSDEAGLSPNPKLVNTRGKPMYHYGRLYYSPPPLGNQPSALGSDQILIIIELQWQITPLYSHQLNFRRLLRKRTGQLSENDTILTTAYHGNLTQLFLWSSKTGPRKRCTQINQPVRSTWFQRQQRDVSKRPGIFQ